jgi:tetratricopeptide (TPR) repeat protein
MSEVLDRVKVLRERAKARTASADRRRRRNDAPDYSEPVEILGEAIDLLHAELKKSEARGADEAGDSSGALAGALADCYGMLGGVYRRAGDFDRSIEAYGQGETYELNPAYDVQNSYNITNAIAVRILKEPQSLRTQGEQIAEAIEFIEKQVKGPRREQWWAWADLGELRLLAGRIEEAREAYREFKDRGPRARDFESTTSVLNELAKSVARVDKEIAEAIASTALSLNENKPSM